MRVLIYFQFIQVLIPFAYSTMSSTVLSSHVLDTSTGRPAAGLFVQLYKNKEDSWMLWHNTATNADGRIVFPFTKDSMDAGTYKLVFNVEHYYKASEKETIYPSVEIIFKTEEDQHYHIPLLLSPYGYTTYRGS